MRKSNLRFSGSNLFTKLLVAFQFESLTRSIRSQMFTYPSDLKPSSIFVRINSRDSAEALTALSAAWKGISPDLPVKFSFLNEKFDTFYNKEKRWSHIVGWAGGICIFLACIELLGLTSLSVTNRSKEIGIRKVNGARISEILTMLNRDFVKWIAIAFVIAIPIAYYTMNKWLENFAYETYCP